jgi:hypothetical protein
MAQGQTTRRETMRLYRAGNSDILTGVTSFAADIADAREYLDNPGYGGNTLYTVDIDIDAEHVLDIRDSSDGAQVDALIEITGIDMGAVTADYMLSAGHVIDALIDRGYYWVRLMDTYPEGCETWTWLYAGEEPDLEEYDA